MHMLEYGGLGKSGTKQLPCSGILVPPMNTYRDREIVAKASTIECMHGH